MFLNKRVWKSFTIKINLKIRLFKLGSLFYEKIHTFDNIILITSFSVLGIFIMETKALKNQNLQINICIFKEKNHLNFFKEYIKRAWFKDTNHLKWRWFIWYLRKNWIKNSSYIAHIYVKAKDFDI